MNKEMFLKELSDRLQILNEQERQELLEEYAQHIDLKIESGLSEEDAVKDFGTPEKLCAELLDVYHINSEFAAQSGEKKKIFEGIPIPKLKRESDNKGEKTEEQIAREEERKLKSEENRAKAALCKEERLAKREEKKEKRKEKLAAMCVAHEEKKRLRQEHRLQVGGSWLGRFFGKLWDLTVLLLLVCWKFCLFCAAVPVIFCGLLALFCTGTVAVLLQQGYPLVGIMLIGTGVFLASAGISGLILSCVFSGKKRKHDTDN